MTGMQAFDMGIGLIFIYLSLSLVCTAVNEFLAGMRNWRATNLATGIKNLLQDDHGRNLERDFYDHPMIKSLRRHKKDSDLPSYIPPQTFSLVLLDILRSSGKGDMKKDPGAPIRTILEGNLSENSDLRRNLLLLLDVAKDDEERFRENVEIWYNDVMNRVSGWYKRKLQWLTLVVALVISVASNADTIQIARALANDPGLRQSLVVQAETMVKAQQTAAPGEEQKAVGQALRETRQELGKLGVPLGWDNAFPEGYGIVSKIVGLLITTFAISLGAPFWFDLLNRFVRIRSAGPEDGRIKKAAPQG